MADLPELVGFFSYSREDDADSHGALSALRTRIQGELRGQLGRTAKTFRLWQDKEAIPSGTPWESEIKTAVDQSVFFIPIITPTVVASPYCKFELESFLTREAALERDNLVFPILYIDVPALEDPVRRRDDPILSLIAKRQYVDWREFRHLDANATEVKRAVERFCAHIRDALNRPWISPQERRQKEEAAARQKAEAEAKRREEEEAKRRKAEEERRRREVEAEQRRKEAAEAKRRADEEARLRAERRRAAGAVAVGAGSPGGSQTPIFPSPGTNWSRSNTRKHSVLGSVLIGALFVVLVVWLALGIPVWSADESEPIVLQGKAQLLHKKGCYYLEFSRYFPFIWTEDRMWLSSTPCPWTGSSTR